MINERLKRRLKKDRPSTTITMRIPTDVVESLKAVAPMRGFCFESSITARAQVYAQRGRSRPIS
jgi:hypothetical protein